jgi:hypothetical protein
MCFTQTSYEHWHWSRILIIPSKNYLRVPVAERSAHSAHALTQSHMHWRGVAQVHVIIKSPVIVPPLVIIDACSRRDSNLRVPRRRRVCQSDSAIESVSTRVRLLILPHPPNAIDLSMMQVEPRVAVGSYKVAAGVTTNSKVTGGVHTHEVVNKCRHATLHVRPEAVDALALEEVDD